MVGFINFFDRAFFLFIPGLRNVLGRGGKYEFGWLIFFFLLGFSIENLSFGYLPVQSFSLALLLSPFVFFCDLRSFNFRKRSFLFFTSLLLYGLFLFLFNYSSHGNYYPMIRQLISLLGGIMIYLACMVVHKRLPLNELADVLNILSFPILLFGVTQKIYYLFTGSGSRITVFFTEPSHYGDYLVLIVLPFIFYRALNEYKDLSRNSSFTFGLIILFLLNMIFVQSGSAILKLSSLVAIFFVLTPGYFFLKIVTAAGLSLLLLASYFVPNSYVKYLVDFSISSLNGPGQFLMHHTFYDRFYPLFGSISHLYETNNIFGLGLGADFYTVKEIFLPDQYSSQLYMKPYGSYLNSLFAKFVLYFGFYGAFGLCFLSSLGLRRSNYFVRIFFLNVFFAGLWGISSFASVYFWFWLSLSLCTNQQD